jgi:anti-sigma-K factor RskA
MIPSDEMIRFEELSAGRALGDLSLEEERELQALAGRIGISPDLGFELLAASLEIDALQAEIEPLPDELAARLRKCAAEQSLSPKNLVRPPIPFWQSVLRSPLTGWAAAAAILIFVAVRTDPTAVPDPVVVAVDDAPRSPAQAEAALREKAGDLIERQFEGLGDFAEVSGSVTWSDEFQQGYMTLKGIPPNDPSQAQYQLWIVDPKRDEAPVDGGVFDIPSDGSIVVVPIQAKLLLTDPQAFVITLEQPGGVVKSKQEKVVALAKN